MKLPIFAAALALMAAGTATAQEWVGIDGTDTAILGYDRASVRDVAGGRSAWVITVFARTQPDEPQGYDFVTTRSLFDCDNERVKTTSNRSFLFGQQRPGRLINEEGDWEDHQPESVFGRLLAVVCETSDLGERQTFSSSEAFARDARRLLTQ